MRSPSYHLSGGKNLTVLLDSWAWIEYTRRSPRSEKIRNYIEGDEPVILSAINIAEVYRFFLANKPRETEHFVAFILARASVIPVDISIAKDAAKIRHEKKFGLGDAIVLATGQQKNAKIITGDSDFRNEKNVEIIT